MSAERVLRERAYGDAKVVRHVLGSNCVPLAGSVVARKTRLNGRDVWGVAASPRLEIWKGELPGRWCLKLDLTYDVDALAGASSVFVRHGSLGLAWQPTEKKKERSFIRYDVDVEKTISLGEPCHFHVLQEETFNDRLHFRVPAVGIEEWPLGPTLEFLCSAALRDEIKERLES